MPLKHYVWQTEDHCICNEITIILFISKMENCELLESNVYQMLLKMHYFGFINEFDTNFLANFKMIKIMGNEMG